MKVVIVGGVAGGATAAARIRRLDEQAEIVVFERSGFVSYANCGLPYYIGGMIEDPEDLTLLHRMLSLRMVRTGDSQLIIGKRWQKTIMLGGNTGLPILQNILMPTE